MFLEGMHFLFISYVVKRFSLWSNVSIMAFPFSLTSTCKGIYPPHSNPSKTWVLWTCDSYSLWNVWSFRRLAACASVWVIVWSGCKTLIWSSLIVFLQRLAAVHFNWHSPSNGLLRAGKYRLFGSTNARGSHGVKCCRRGKWQLSPLRFSLSQALSASQEID